MSAATKVIKKVAAGLLTGHGLKKKADEVVAGATVTTTKLCGCKQAAGPR